MRGGEPAQRVVARLGERGHAVGRVDPARRQRREDDQELGQGLRGLA